MGDWGLGAETDGWAPSNPHFSEKGNAGADNWNHDSNEPAGNTGDFNDNYNDNYDDGGYKGDANEAGAYANDKCFGCGEEGHRRADCPNAGEQTCRYCKKEGHMVKDCPDKPPMICANCGEEGHFRKNCENARKINRDHVADTTPDDAWAKIKQAARERDSDDVKEAVEEYVKALGGEVTYRQIQEKLMEENVKLWLISLERELIDTFTNMDLQGNIDKKYSVSFRFSDKPERPREIDGWPQGHAEILSRLEDAGMVVDRGLPKCYNCGELGHTSKGCTQERVEHASEKPKISCYNCGNEGHRVRDCPEPRVDKFACKNCGKSGHRIAECPEPPNLDNVECRKCNKTGHFAKDCPDGGGRACRNCGQEGHISKDCDQPRNMDLVVCRNCEETGHYSKECPKPRDWSKVQCSNCEEYGHTKVRCKQPPKDSEAFTEQNFGNAGEQPSQADSYADNSYADNAGGDGGNGSTW
ncbi:cellular nucleic acid-binding protein homolog [Trichoderma asperellum]|uniref:Cellular nucleic acid-binding protein homolog n=1 Tax=Trichoderma asperellum TaxID=101201 RepID=A0A6V8QUP8_TRIAP|nr:cellular nucleic acid-binding protein homolog [Trichoderma asperellum]